MRFILLMSAVLLIGCRDGSSTATVDTKPVASLNAVQLWDEYGANGLAADGKYKGQYVELSGSVRNVQQGKGDRYFVGFAVVSPAALPDEEYNALNSREKKWFTEGYPPNVECYLSPTEHSVFANVKEGQSIKVVAKVVGRRTADVWGSYMVELEDARLLK